MKQYQLNEQQYNDVLIYMRKQPYDIAAPVIHFFANLKPMEEAKIEENMSAEVKDDAQ